MLTRSVADHWRSLGYTRHVDVPPPPVVAEVESEPQTPLDEEELRRLPLDTADRGEHAYARLRGWSRSAVPDRQVGGPPSIMQSVATCALPRTGVLLSEILGGADRGR